MSSTMKDASEMALTSHQRAQLLHLRACIRSSEDVVVSGTRPQKRTQSAENESEKEQTPPPAAAASDTRNALLEQLRLAKKVRLNLEESVKMAEKEHSDERRALAKKLLKERTDDILQLVALTEAVRGRYTLDSYDQYLNKEEDAEVSEAVKRARKTLQNHCRRMDSEVGAAKLAFFRRTQQDAKHSLPSPTPESQTHSKKLPPEAAATSVLAARPLESPPSLDVPSGAALLGAASGVPAAQSVLAPSLPVTQNTSAAPVLTTAATTPIVLPVPLLLVQPQNLAQAEAVRLAPQTATPLQISTEDDAGESRKRDLDEVSGEPTSPIDRLARSYADAVARSQGAPDVEMVDLTQDSESDH